METLELWLQSPRPTRGYEEQSLFLKLWQTISAEAWVNQSLSRTNISVRQRRPAFHRSLLQQITSKNKKMRVPNVPITTIKLMLFPFSIEGAARIWLEKEPPRSIQTWDDLVSKFIKQFIPLLRHDLRNEITRFQQRFDESFYEAWDRFNDLLRACPHHGFSELHQLDTFYNALNINDQDSLNSAAGGNFLDKMPRDYKNHREQVQDRKTVNHDTEVTKDTMPPANNGSTEDVQPPVVQIQSRNPNPEPIVAPVVAPVPNTKPSVSLPYPSRRDNEKSRNQANEQIDKFL
ncbi:reverse transcriptase domain-containing protein [Tanacetum coccineum]